MTDSSHASAQDRARRAVVIGLALSAAWLVLVLGFFVVAGIGDGDGLRVLPAIMIVIAIVGPIALIASVSVAMALVAQATQDPRSGGRAARAAQARRPTGGPPTCRLT